jgi:hypothetical protein
MIADEYIINEQGGVYVRPLMGNGLTNGPEMRFSILRPYISNPLLFLLLFLHIDKKIPKPK